MFGMTYVGKAAFLLIVNLKLNTDLIFPMKTG